MGAAKESFAQQHPMIQLYEVGAALNLLERFEFKILGDDIVAGVYLFGIPAIHVNTAARKCCHTH